MSSKFNRKKIFTVTKLELSDPSDKDKDKSKDESVTPKLETICENDINSNKSQNGDETIECVDDDNVMNAFRLNNNIQYRRGATRSKFHTEFGGQRRTWASTVQVKNDVPALCDRRFNAICGSCDAELEFGVNDITVNRPNWLIQLLGYDTRISVQCPMCLTDQDVKSNLPKWLIDKL